MASSSQKSEPKAAPAVPKKPRGFVPEGGRRVMRHKLTPVELEARQRRLERERRKAHAAAVAAEIAALRSNQQSARAGLLAVAAAPR